MFEVIFKIYLKKYREARFDICELASVYGFAGIIHLFNFHEADFSTCSVCHFHKKREIFELDMLIMRVICDCLKDC